MWPFFPRRFVDEKYVELKIESPPKLYAEVAWWFYAPGSLHSSQQPENDEVKFAIIATTKIQFGWKNNFIR